MTAYGTKRTFGAASCVMSTFGGKATCTIIWSDLPRPDSPFRQFLPVLVPRTSVPARRIRTVLNWTPVLPSFDGPEDAETPFGSGKGAYRDGSQEHCPSAQGHRETGTWGPGHQQGASRPGSIRRIAGDALS